MKFLTWRDTDFEFTVLYSGLGKLPPKRGKETRKLLNGGVWSQTSSSYPEPDPSSQHEGSAAVVCGSVVLWFYGSADLWTCGSVNLWVYSSVDLWFCGSIDLWFCGSVILWV